MTKAYNYLLIGLGLLVFLSCKQVAEHNTYETLREAFLNPSQSARPKVYWWCLNGYIDTIRAKEELKAILDWCSSNEDKLKIMGEESEKIIRDFSPELFGKNIELASRAALDNKQITKNNFIDKLIIDLVLRLNSLYGKD